MTYGEFKKWFFKRLERWDESFNEDGLYKHHTEEPEMRLPNRFMIRDDCFGFRQKQCRIVPTLECQFGECPFYKSREQDWADREKYPYTYPAEKEIDECFM